MMSLAAHDYSEHVDTWTAIHDERTRLADALEHLEGDQWDAPTLCQDWSVAQVVAHLSAVANTGTFAWLRSIVRAGFNTDKHNARLLERYLSDDHAGTFATYRRSIPLTTAPARAYVAVLGEVIVHGQDIAHPFGIRLDPDPASVRAVADFFATKDFAVNSKTLVRDLRLQASDATFEIGTGPLVRGTLLDLVMIMAGRSDYLEWLEGDGVAELSSRLERSDPK